MHQEFAVKHQQKGFVLVCQCASMFVGMCVNAHAFVSQEIHPTLAMLQLAWTSFGILKAACRDSHIV